jgi:hypothetical protein
MLASLPPPSIEWNRHRQGTARRSDPDDADRALGWIASLPLAMTALVRCESDDIQIRSKYFLMFSMTASTISKFFPNLYLAGL